MGGAKALVMVWLVSDDGLSAEGVVVMRVLLGIREGMVRQVVGDGRRKVRAARMRGGIEKCMMLEMRLADKAGDFTECYRSCGTNLVTNICWRSF